MNGIFDAIDSQEPCSWISTLHTGMMPVWEALALSDQEFVFENGQLGPCVNQKESRKQ